MTNADTTLVCGTDSIFKDPSKSVAFADNLRSARFSEEALRKLPNLEKYRGIRMSIAVVGLQANVMESRDELLFLVSLPGKPEPMIVGHYFATALTDLSTEPATTETPTEIHEYAFDLRLSCAVRVKAASKAEATQLLDRIKGYSAIGVWPNGDPIHVDVSTDEGTPYCFAVDGKATED